MPVAPLSRLKTALDIYEFTAADEILAAFRLTHGLPLARDPDLGIPLAGPRADAADDYMARRTDLIRVYPEWRRDLKDTMALRILDAVLFHELSLTSIDSASHWRKGTARKHLAVALKHFAALRGNVPRGAHNWRYRPS